MTQERTRLDLPLTTASGRAAELYRDAEARMTAAESGSLALIDEALAADTEFALAHAARYLLTLGARDAEAAEQARERMLALAEGVTPWESSHIATLAKLAKGDASLAAEHIAEHPSDMLVLSEWLGYLILHGGAGKRRKVLDAVRSVAASYGEDWALQSRLGFALGEAGQADEGEKAIRVAMAQRPGSPFIMHSMAHVLYEQGSVDASAALLREWLGEHPGSGSLHGHLHWHLALNEMHQGSTEAALDRYERFAAPPTTTCGPDLALADAGGMLFRLYLAGERAALPEDGVRELLADLAGGAGSPFVAFHGAVALTALGDRDGLQAWNAKARRAAEGSSGALTEALVEAVWSFFEGEPQKTVELLATLGSEDREAIGGSNVERELVELLEQAAVQRVN